MELDGVRSPEAQAIIDAELGKEELQEEEEEVVLPSDEDDTEEEVLLAGKYKTTEELIKGIKNIGSNLPEYVLNGMSDEALEQHYKEIRKDFSKGKEGRKHAEKKVDDTKQIPEKDEDNKAVKVEQELWNELETQFSTTGYLTDEHYDKLNKQGIPDVVIDKYLDGLKAEQVMFTEKVMNIAGGQDNYNAIKEWAEENEPDMVEAISRQKDYAVILTMMKGLKASYDIANNSVKGNTIRGSIVPKPSNNTYKTEAEYMNDVKSEQYRKDPRFREKVQAKLKRSNITT